MAKLYGVRVIVNGREGWARLPGGVKGYPVFSDAQKAADDIARRTDLPAFVRERPEC